LEHRLVSESRALPGQLTSPEPTWSLDTDIVVLGSGAAGLSAALAARPLRDVLLITKDTLDAGSTNWAQGGLAAVLDPNDLIENHVRDTLVAGAGLCDEPRVRELVSEAPNAIRYLMSLGAIFDSGASEGMALSREGGHSHRRVVRAGGDQSGAEVQRTLEQSVRNAGVQIMEHAIALDLLMATTAAGTRVVAGVRVARVDESGNVESVGHVTARAVIVATGGFGQVYASTSNPPSLTGDGVAMALRAGAATSNLEFIQFHPTVLWRGADACGQQALISEAVRGEGAQLRDGAGDRIMAGVHPLEDLAPRDVVAAAISTRMANAPGGVADHVFLDARAIDRFDLRFPTITASCLAVGVDPSKDLIPVAPAAHYVCGGVVANLDGVTALEGLFVAGEAACTGVHGANRLASNSLTEAVVMGTRLGRSLSWSLPGRVAIETNTASSGLLDGTKRWEVRAVMSKYVGVLRTPDGLASAAKALRELGSVVSVTVPATRSSFEATNLLTIAMAVVASARAREESRGCHSRVDFIDTRDEWRHQLSVTIREGRIEVT
jgi:L-aspartate oxidase